jgi:hypothetical protein
LKNFGKYYFQKAIKKKTDWKEFRNKAKPLILKMKRRREFTEKQFRGRKPVEI